MQGTPGGGERYGMDEAADQLDRADVAAQLRCGSFREALENGEPLVVLAGEPARLVYASEAAFAEFGRKTPESLAKLLIGQESPGARRLRRLLAAGGSTGQRVEHLRYFADGAVMAVNLAAERMDGPAGEAWLVLAAPRPMPAPALAPASENVPPSAPAPEAEAPAPAEAFSPPPLDGPVRFLWATDGEGRFSVASGEAQVRLGPNAPRIGERVADLEQRLGLGDAWSRALAARSTFSGLKLEWTEVSGDRARLAKLSGAPVFEPAGGFGGFRGFGVFTGEAVSLTPAAPGREPAVGERDRGAGAAPGSGAEIVAWRHAAPASNVVPIRQPVPNGGDGPASEVDPLESVELTVKEREAFREIARALGARGRPGGEAEASPLAEPTAEDHAKRDLRDMSALVETLPIGALVLRGDEALFANRALLELAGYPSFEAFVGEEGPARIFRDGVPQGAGEGDREVSLVAANGDILRVTARLSELEWAGSAATLVSLRRSREAEFDEQAKLSRAKERESVKRATNYLSVLDGYADGFVYLDANGRLLAMSPAAEALFGYRNGTSAGTHFLALLAPQCHAPALAAFLNALNDEQGDVRNNRLAAQARAENGRDFPCRLTFGRLDEAGDRQVYILFESGARIAAQALDEQSALAEAVRANARKTEFLAAVSHEIRTPLQAILGFAEVMIEERFGPIGNERYKAYLKDMLASGNHVVSLANDLIDLAKIEAGKFELDFVPVDINQTIRDCSAIMQPQAARERIIMRTSLSDKIPAALADARSVRQILLNLMSNAVKFNEPGGQVIVSTALSDAGAPVIRVRDTGIGMSESELAVALEPFRRPENGKLADGAGLGLPLTKALVEANHAKFSIKSRKEQGTLVEIAFANLRAAQ